MYVNPRYAMAIDLERCTGCHACSVACKVEYDAPLGNFRTKVYYYDKGVFPKVTRSFLPVVCMQCEDAPCLNSCPTGAITRGEDGIVRVDAETCDANGACESACPYGAIYVHPQHRVAEKCDFCAHRLKAGMEPACVETCPGEVFVFGDLDDPDSDIVRFNNKYQGELTVLKPQENTHPRVTYRGLDRDLEKKIPKGRNHDPASYEIKTWAAVRATFDADGGRCG